MRVYTYPNSVEQIYVETKSNSENFKTDKAQNTMVANSVVLHIVPRAIYEKCFKFVYFEMKTFYALLWTIASKWRTLTTSIKDLPKKFYLVMKQLLNCIVIQPSLDNNNPYPITEKMCLE